MSAVRNAIDIVRYDVFGARIGGADASVRGQWLTLIVSGVFVFGCFFAIGRMRSQGSSSSGEGSSAAPAYAERAAIPGALRGGSPIAGAVPSAIATPPPPPKPLHAVTRTRTLAPSAGASAQSLAAEAREAFAPSAQPQSSSAQEVARAPSETAPPSAPERQSGSASQGSSSGKHAGAESSGGGSFDSSE